MILDNDDIDGMNHWDDIQNLRETKRQEFIYNLDDMNPPINGHAAIRYGPLTERNFLICYFVRFLLHPF